MPDKLFTPEEANRRLPYVRQIVSEILSKGQRLRALLILPHRTPALDEECKRLEGEVIALMKEIENLGCYFKDWNFEIGLVDFPAIINGREVLLCWRSDEPAVEWFHGIEDGYAGRLPITRSLLIS